MKANHSYLNLSDQLIDDNPLPQSGFKSMSSIQMKVLNRNYFEELAWRHFVCI